MTSIVGAFNNHFVEFLEDVHSIFPEDKQIKTAKNALMMLKKANPSVIVKIWKEYITTKYKEQIYQGNMDFFINKDYSEDLQTAGNQNTIMESINRLRDPIRNMGSSNQEKAMKYIQNLTKISELYN